MVSIRTLLLVLVSISQQSHARQFLSCEQLLNTLQVNLPVFKSIKFGIPKGASGIWKPAEEADRALLVESETYKIELGIWHAYNNEGKLLAASRVISGQTEYITVAAIRDEYEMFWDQLTKKYPSSEIGKVSFTHTHPETDRHSNIGMIHSYDRFSKEDNGVGQFLISTYLPLKADRAHLDLEMYLLFRHGEWARKIGYKLKGLRPIR